jgi:hypothetical protein
MTRRFKSLVLEGVSHMIDDPQGDWVRWCDCRDVERELSRLREGMPKAEDLHGIRMNGPGCAVDKLTAWIMRATEYKAQSYTYVKDDSGGG